MATEGVINYMRTQLWSEEGSGDHDEQMIALLKNKPIKKKNLDDEQICPKTFFSLLVYIFG